MSHIVQIRTEVRDPDAVAAACLRLGLPSPERGTAQLFSGQAAGLLVRLEGWAYPIVIETATGEVRYDNYNGAWGGQEQLDRFLQFYAVERAKIEARRRGHSVTEQDLPDGSIKVTIGVGGAA
jgi:hypothetical protein